MPAIKTKKPETITDKIVEAFKKHQDFVETILKDNAFTEDAELEIESATENIREEMIDLFEQSELSTEQIVEKMRSLIEDDQLIENDKKELLDAIGSECMIDWLNDKDYIFLKIKSADKRDRLKEFVEAEIFPYYNDRIGAETNIL